jgi:hypothetical protein
MVGRSIGSVPSGSGSHSERSALADRCAALADLGHLLEGCVGNPLSLGDHAPRHGVSR